MVPGAGGVEASLFAEEIFNLYLEYTRNLGFEVCKQKPKALTFIKLPALKAPFYNLFRFSRWKLDNIQNLLRAKTL